jgi:hypothetical protein
MGAPAQVAAGDHRRWISWFALILTPTMN